MTRTVSRTFTDDFLMASERVNGAFQVLFQYDDTFLDLIGAGDLTIYRDGNGFVHTTVLGTTTDYHVVNGFGEPIEQVSSVGETEVFRVEIVRDPIGRIAQRNETVDGITRVSNYGYDAAGRLDSVTGTVAETYSYDPNGNRLSATRAQQLLGEGTYDDQDRLLTYGGATYTYTANGELETKTIAGQTTTYQYDSLGSLIRVEQPDGTVITYQVDGRGRRVGKSINGVSVRRWLYGDQLRIVAELDGAGTVVSRFVYSAKPNVPEYMVQDGVTYRIFSDHLSSPRVVVNATTGEIVQRMDFRSFGEVFQDSNPGFQPFGFAGGLYDADTGLVRFGARDYNPHVGRWTAKDPAGFLDGPNVYGYVWADPVNFADPTGLCGEYIDRYLQHLNNYMINVGPYAAALAGGLWPKSLAPATGGRPPALGSGNPLTSVPRALGMPGGGSTVARGGAAAIGVATVGIGMYNVGVLASGLAYAAFPGSNGLPAGPECKCGGQ